MISKNTSRALAGILAACGLVFMIQASNATSVEKLNQLGNIELPTPPGAMEKFHQAMNPNAPKDIYAPSMGKMMMAMHQQKPTGNVDIDFARQMIPHHQAAIDMAETLSKNSTNPEMKKLAQEIIAAQTKEIAYMQEWLKKNDTTAVPTK